MIYGIMYHTIFKERPKPFDPWPRVRIYILAIKYLYFSVYTRRHFADVFDYPSTVVCKKVHKISFLDLKWQMTKFKSHALHMIRIKYWKASGSGNPPSIIPVLRKIAILGLKNVLFCTRLDSNWLQSCASKPLIIKFLIFWLITFFGVN